ncbi:protein transport protein Sec31A-like isoform X2 [Myxocyprinus asiaticus]|uniref:protein transport protein Sec31A-like isoform X2 n=1 Tax=Myxocyprinus asiaticus TaxID=70543 RepID=UPI00222309E3|nr:protein transport protein Sec31A-like isoform X2 [Myxocyprinus asiaticus]
MKLKEINRTAIQAWSPVQQHPVYLAAGTSAQQLDATFSTNASLEIFELDLAEPTLAMKSCGSFSSPHRYHKLVWGAHGIESEGLPSGVLIAGGENGNIILYDASKIIAGDSEVIISQSEKHTGPVRALDVNSFQTNLVASGGNESEIYIWDLNSFSSPMTPGPKTQPLEDISCVAWNRQVQHILASASPSGKASVWDLRKNDLIIKVSDHSNRMHCSGLAWNPEVATQLVLASEDDRMPVIQMWDLRFATSPLKVLENHTRGVLAIAWSVADPELLLSCGKDNRILCWNPNTAEVLYELPTSAQWCFDIQWCPRNPAVLSAAAFDGHISIYSIMGGSNDNAINAQADQLSSSFGNMDPFGTGKTLPPLQLPQPTNTQSTITPLKKPPKWIRRPVGASFAFGGKLVTLDNIKSTAQQPQQTAAHVVHISQVVTETDFLDRSNQLQTTLTAGNFLEYCQTKIEAAQNEFEKTVWSFLKVNFEDDARGKYLELLGYKEEELAIKIASALEGDCKSDKDNVHSSNSALVTNHHPTPAPVLGSDTNHIVKPEMLSEAQPKPAPIAVVAATQSQLGFEPEHPPTLELNLQSVNESLFNPTLAPSAEPKLEVKPESEPLVDFISPIDLTTSFDLTPLVDLTSSLDKTSPFGLAFSLDQTSQVDPTTSFDQTPPVDPTTSFNQTPPVDPTTSFDRKPPIDPTSSFDQTPSVDLTCFDQTPLVDPTTSFDQTPLVDITYSLEQTPPVDPTTSFDRKPPIDPTSSFDQTPSVDLTCFDQTPPVDPTTSFDQTPLVDITYSLEQKPPVDHTTFFDQIPPVDLTSLDQTPQVDPTASFEQTPPVDPTTSFDQTPSIDFASSLNMTLQVDLPSGQQPVPPTDHQQSVYDLENSNLQLPTTALVTQESLPSFPPPVHFQYSVLADHQLSGTALTPQFDPHQSDLAPLLELEESVLVLNLPADLQYPVSVQTSFVDLQQPALNAVQLFDPQPVSGAALAPSSDVVPQEAMSMKAFPIDPQQPAQESDLIVPQLFSETDHVNAGDCQPRPQIQEVSGDAVPKETRVKKETALEEVEENSSAEEKAELPAAETSDLDEIPVDDDEPVVEETSITEDSPAPALDHVTAPAFDVVNLKVSQDIDGLITQALLTGDYEAAVNLCLHDNRMADGIILAIAGGPELLAKTQKKYFTKTQSKISKLICAVLMKDWLDILETCDLQNWKEALAAVMTYAKPEEFSSLCGLLGSRLESAEDTELQAQACLCYICAGAVEQLVAYWAKAQDSNSPLLLQELVEKVVILQRAVQKAQGGVSPDVGTLLAEKMNQYASLLASQGNLQTAISYLPSNTEQVAVQQLRDRLRRALGQEQSAAVMQNTQPAIPAAASVQTYTPVQPQPSQVPTQPTAPAVPPQYYQQGRSATTVTSWSNQTPTALPSVPRPFVPAADPQAEPTPPAFGLQSAVNASVPSSAPFMYSQQYQNYTPVQQFTPGIYQPVHYSSSAASCLPPPPSSSAASVYPPQFMHPAVSQPPPQGGQPFSPPHLSSGVSFQHGGPGSPTAYLPPAVRRASGTEIAPALIPASQKTGPQNGWNDPPSLNRAPKKKKIPENYTPPAPITAPIMTPLGDPQALAAPGTQTHHPQQQVPDQPVAPAPFNPTQQQSMGPPTQNPHLPQVHMEGAPGAPIGDLIKPLQSIPTEKITKKPIPEEHMVLKTTFEGLIQKCLAAASDPQTKRKLDDAHKRLEFLYDKLREQTLSPAIVGGLHNMAHSIECRSYTDGLNIHTHIVSNSNFSETSAFMPVLKVVLTQASKLGV